MNPSQIQRKLRDMEEMASSPSAARLSVDLSALTQNHAEVVRRAAPAGVAPVVKADAYGLGVEPIAQKLAVKGADSFFVARMEEGVALRPIVPNARIFVFDGLLRGAAQTYVAHNLIPVLNSVEEIAEYSAHARENRSLLDAAIQIDTGINRLGLSHEDVSALSAAPSSTLNGLNLALIMSHLACADEPVHKLNRTQLERFRASLAALPPAPASLAATAGIELGADFLFDMVRPGLGLYGGNPNPNNSNPYACVATLSAKVIQIREIEIGETVGYGASFTATKPSRLAIIALGYADGLIRAMGPHGQAAIDGIRVPYAGRISMDLTVLDVTEIAADKCARGTEVELLGRAISLEEFALAAGTNSHEVLTSLSKRVSHEYVE
jgi:alanine racemase